MIKRVFLRIYRPDNFIKRLKHFAGIVRNGAYFFLKFTRNCLRIPGVFTQKGYPAELGTHYIMQVLSDACAFPLQYPLLFQAFEALSHHHAGTSGNKNDYCKRRRCDKPSSLPKMWKHNQREACAVHIPNPISIAGNHLKAIVARRHEAVKGYAPCSRLNPVWIQPF